jgi:hypothetical protein
MDTFLQLFYEHRPDIILRYSGMLKHQDIKRLPKFEIINEQLTYTATELVSSDCYSLDAQNRSVKTMARRCINTIANSNAGTSTNSDFWMETCLYI